MAMRSKEQIVNALREAHDCAFCTQNNRSFSSLSQFASELGKMRPDVYKYHVGEGYNHFSNWIKDVFGDEKLASDIFSVSKKDALKFVRTRLKWLEKKAK